MSATVQQVIDPCRTASRDPSGTGALVSDTEYIALVDNSQREAICFVPDEASRELQVETNINTVAPVIGVPYGTAALPTNFFMFRMAMVKQSTNGTFFIARTIKLESFYKDQRPAQTIKTDERNPDIAIVGASIFVSPCATVTGGLKLFYVSEPTRLTAVGNALQVSGALQAVVVNLTLYHVFNKMGRSDQAGFYAQLAGQQIQSLGGRWFDRALMAPPDERRTT